MDGKQLLVLAFQISIILMVFGFGLRATLDDVLFLIRRPGLLLRSVLSVFVIMPIAAYLFARLFDFRPAVEIALVALSLSPVPPILPRKAMKLGGDKAYALGLLVVLSALAIVFVPLALAILGLLTGHGYLLQPPAVSKAVVMSTLFPLAFGTALRTALPHVAELIEKPVTLIATLLLAIAAVVLLIAAAPAIWALIGDGTVVALAAFAALGYLVGHLLGGPDRDQSLVLAFSTACRHPAIALAVATAAHPEVHTGGAILLYFLVSAIVGAIYARVSASELQPA
jgi:bile acid:Na+ symporter, BASS family